jgi:hypothetical protein
MRCLIVALAIVCSALPGSAQERGDVESWRTLAGADRGAAGVCMRLDDDETESCFIVRCAGAGRAELVYRTGDEFFAAPTRFRLSVGRVAREVEFRRARPLELVAAIEAGDPLISAMRRPARADPMLRLLARGEGSYSTAFMLRGADATIGRALAGCSR